jgi:hypothetical protein
MSQNVKERPYWTEWASQTKNYDNLVAAIFQTLAARFYRRYTNRTYHPDPSQDDSSLIRSVETGRSHNNFMFVIMAAN